MQYKFRTDESKFIFSAPTVVTLTDAIVDASDTLMSSDTITAYCPSATVPDDYSERRYMCTATDLTLATVSRFVFGNFLSDSAQKSLENETARTQAQVLSLKAQTDRTNLQNKLTNETWDELILGPLFQNLGKAANIEYTDAKRNILPERAMAWEKYLAETARTDATAKHAQQLYNLAKQEGQLKQADIDMLERLSAAPTGLKYVIDFLKIILQSKMK